MSGERLVLVTQAAQIDNASDSRISRANRSGVNVLLRCDTACRTNHEQKTIRFLSPSRSLYSTLRDNTSTKSVIQIFDSHDRNCEGHLYMSFTDLLFAPYARRFTFLRIVSRA